MLFSKYKLKKATNPVNVCTPTNEPKGGDSIKKSTTIPFVLQSILTVEEVKYVVNGLLFVVPSLLLMSYDSVSYLVMTVRRYAI